jgi:prepilin-type N-terminal cleavage/methylation domain-containing protein
MRTPTHSRRGFSLVEIITALTILAIIGGAMTKMLLAQTRGYQHDNGGRRSRTVARTAMNIMITDLRMTQDNGGVSYLDATDHRAWTCGCPWCSVSSVR